MSGYSPKSLSQKLGYQAPMKVCVLDQYSSYWQDIGELSPNIKVDFSLESSYQLIHCFSRSWEDLNLLFPRLLEHVADQGMIWISWPKKSAKVATDLDENKVREIGLALGVVDVKVCAVNEVWSGLKFLRRKQTIH